MIKDKFLVGSFLLSEQEINELVESFAEAEQRLLRENRELKEKLRMEISKD